MKKRVKKFIKTCPLVVCILCSWAIVAAAEHLPMSLREMPSQEMDSPEKESWINGETQEITAHGALGGVIASNRAPDLSEQAIMDGDGPEDPKGIEDPSESNAVHSDDGSITENTDTENTGKEHLDAGNTGKEDTADAKPQKIKPEYISYEKKKTDSPWYTDPGKIPQTTDYGYQKVKNDYFDDAVFIGDSRIVGMNDYSGLTNATFFAKTGLTVYNLLDDEFVKDPKSGKNVSVSYMMQHNTYGKIYLMVGINELGTGGTERFQNAYKEVLKKFRKWQPDAVIYVQSIMGVSPKKDKSDPVFNNTNIRDKNYAISKLTDGIHIFYLNIQEIYEDENHNLAQELTFDDVHLYAQHYDKWVKYLKTHAVVK